jgi:hemoglobin
MKKRNSLQLVMVGLFVMLCIGVQPDNAQAGGSFQISKGSAAYKEKSLFERLGGQYKIAAIVDDFVEGLLVNDVLKANAKLDRISKEVKPGHKFETTLIVSSMTGGPYKYAGRSLREAHKNLEITEEQWKAGIAELQNACTRNNVAAAEQRELVELIEKTKNDIVTK